MGFIYAAIAGVLIGIIMKGRITELGNLKFKHAYLVFSSIILQFMIFNPVWEGIVGNEAITTYFYITTLFLTAAFALLNIRIFGMPCIFAGTLLNDLAIISNGGHMPASLEAIRGAFPEKAADLMAKESINNSMLINDDTHFKFLGDIFYIPSQVPLANAFSVGDILICLGIVILLVKAMTAGKSRLTFRA